MVHELTIHLHQPTIDTNPVAQHETRVVGHRIPGRMTLLHELVLARHKVQYFARRRLQRDDERVGPTESLTPLIIHCLIYSTRMCGVVLDSSTIHVTHSYAPVHGLRCAW